MNGIAGAAPVEIAPAIAGHLDRRQGRAAAATGDRLRPGQKRLDEDVIVLPEGDMGAIG